MSFGCEWLDNVTLQSSGSFPCEYVKANWSKGTLPTPYPCLAIENYVATQALAVTPAAATAALTTMTISWRKKPRKKILSRKKSRRYTRLRSPIH